MLTNRITITQHLKGSGPQCLRCDVDFDGRQYFASISVWMSAGVSGVRSVRVQLWHATLKERRVSDRTERGSLVLEHIERELKEYLEAICRM